MKFGRFKPWNEWEDHLDGTRHYEFRFKYDTPITSDVLGNLEVDDVVKVLEDISRLADVYELRHQSFVDHDGNVVFVD